MRGEQGGEERGMKERRGLNPETDRQSFEEEEEEKGGEEKEEGRWIRVSEGWNRRRRDGVVERRGRDGGRDGEEEEKRKKNTQRDERSRSGKVKKVEKEEKSKGEEEFH